MPLLWVSSFSFDKYQFRPKSLPISVWNCSAGTVGDIAAPENIPLDSPILGMVGTDVIRGSPVARIPLEINQEGPARGQEQDLILGSRNGCWSDGLV